MDIDTNQSLGSWINYQETGFVCRESHSNHHHLQTLAKRLRTFQYGRSYIKGDFLAFCQCPITCRRCIALWVRNNKVALYPVMYDKESALPLDWVPFGASLTFWFTMLGSSMSLNLQVGGGTDLNVTDPGTIQAMAQYIYSFNQNAVVSRDKLLVWWILLVWRFGGRPN